MKKLLFTLCFLGTLITQMQGQTMYNITFQVDMNTYVGMFDTVDVSGTWNSWCGGCNPLTDPDMDDVWTATIPIPAGYQEFKYTTDAWTDQESLVAGLPCTQTNGGFTNRYINVTGDDTLDLVCWNSCFLCGTPPPDSGNITFRVDWSEYTGAPFTTANVNGNFNGWCGGCNPMFDPDNDSIWEVTIALAGGPIEFKYTADGWNVDEILDPSELCTVNFGAFTNRSYYVDGDDTLSIVCQGSCEPCPSTMVVPSMDTVDVIFRVDMNNETVSADGIHVVGSFQGWNPAGTMMTDANGDGVYEHTTQIIAGDSVLYKFINGNDWPFQEPNAPLAACGLGDGYGGYNRLTVVDTVNMLLDAVCFGSCDTCPAMMPDSGNISFAVDMRGFSGNPYSEVDVNGTWNAWCGTCNPLSDPDMDSIWTGTYLIPGGAQEFKFTVDGWVADEQLSPGLSCVVTNGGFTNRSLFVDGDSTLMTVCWESCDTCGVAGPDSGNVTFAVDMHGYTGAAYSVVNVNGTFNGWCGGCNPLSDPDNDSIWTGTVYLPGGFYEFKYTVDGWTDEEMLMQGLPCTMTSGGFTNRTLNVNGDTTLNTVCWESCDTCSAVVNPPATVDVTFRVDMANETVSTDGVHVVGSFQGWNPSGTMMIDANADGIYEHTAQINPGDTILYKFINGNDWPFQEPNGALAPCGMDDGYGGYNRLTAIDTVNMLLDAVCFGSCDTCPAVINPTTVNVTFKVDMSLHTVSSDGVHIAGNFQNWDPAATQLTDMNGDGVYEVSLDVPESDSLLYKFINGNDWPFQEDGTNLAACGLDDGYGSYNRLAVTSGSDLILPEVCFSSCDTCGAPMSINGNDFIRDFILAPNPTSSTVSINIEFLGYEQGRLELFDLAGKSIRTELISGEHVQVNWDLSQFPSGIYYVKLKTETGMTVRKLIVE